jgi:hypothetical protein
MMTTFAATFILFTCAVLQRLILGCIVEGWSILQVAFLTVEG